MFHNTVCTRTGCCPNANEKGGGRKRKIKQDSRLVHKDVGEKLQTGKGCEDTKEMVQWRSISQEGIHVLWKELSGAMEEEVLESTRFTRQ